MRKRLLYGLAAALAVGLVLVTLVCRPQHYQWAEAFADENPAVRAAAVRDLPRAGYEQHLIDALEDQDADVRLLAAGRLGYAGRNGGERAQALIRLLNDEHAGVRREASWALGFIGPEAWPALREALNDEKPRVRAGAALALVWIYAHKRPQPWPSRELAAVVPVLSELLKDTDPEVQANAKSALECVHR